MGEIFAKVQSLETVLANHLEDSSKQMTALTEAVTEQKGVEENDAYEVVIDVGDVQYKKTGSNFMYFSKFDKKILVSQVFNVIF